MGVLLHLLALAACCAGLTEAASLLCCNSQNQCKCCPGAYYYGKECVPCPPGFYCSTGSGATPCPAGTYNAQPGAASAASCLAWSGVACPPGRYIAAAPNATHDVACAACRSACPGGQYLSGACTGATAADVVRCVACGVCGAGAHRSPPCDGSQKADSRCVACSGGPCPSGMYRGPCGADLDSVCVNCTACPSGFFSRGCNGVADGVCVPCTACQAGTVQFRACGGLLDTGCKGALCNASVPCGALFCSYTAVQKPNCSVTWSSPAGGQNFLCLTSGVQGTCQLCPAGYYASGAHCLECPYGQSCGAGGQVQCRGQCALRTYPTCDASTGYVQCRPCDINATALAQSNKVLTRGGVLDAPELCGAYFDCAAGYYLDGAGDQTQLVCRRCLLPEASASQWDVWSHGLTFGDAYSCLYQPASAPVANNTLGFYGDAGTSCPAGGHTSQPGMARSAADCLRCPNPPPNGRFVAGLFDCSVECGLGFARRGEACVPLDAGMITCPDDGYAVDGGGCAAAPLPWNEPGSQGLGGLASVVEANDAGPLDALDVRGGVAVAGVLPSLLDSYFARPPKNLCTGIVAVAPSVGYVQDRPLFGSTCLDVESHRPYLVLRGDAFVYAFLERSFGFNNRYILWQIDTRKGPGQYGKVWQTWRLPGKVCSAAWTPWPGVEYLHLALCGAPFLIYVTAYDIKDLTPLPPEVTLVTSGANSFAIGRRFGRLIGQDREGVADGMRDTALFGDTLSVANSSDPRRLFVADAENCRLVELVIDRPGSFLTRAVSIGAPSCFSGAFPLPSPRLLTSVLGGGWLLFLTDRGLMQMDTLTRTLQTALPADAMPLEPRWFGAVESGAALVLANRTHTAWVRRLQAPCPEHTTSTRGSGCAECPRTRYALPSGCAECSSPVCGPNQTLVPCGGSRDAHCRECSGRAPYPFVYGGNCSLVPVAPCPAGFYGESTCAACPAWYGPAAYASVPQSGICACFPTGVLLNGTACLVESPFASGAGSEQALAASPWALRLACTYLECPLHGCYLRRAFPRECAACPEGLFGSNGLWCERCGGFRTATQARDACVCLPPTEPGPGGACVCPPGFAAGGPGGCVACAGGTHQPARVHLWEDFRAQPAVACEACAPGTVNSADFTRCVPCPTGTYRDGSAEMCLPCPSATAYARDPARGDSCVECSAACGYGERWLPCPVAPGLFVCEACGPLPSEAHRLVTGRDNRACWTECAAGFYQAGGACVACGHGECAPGFIFTPCSRYADYDCGRPCANASKPALNSVWAEGCSWACAPGFAMRSRSILSWTEYACEGRA